jgi:hypothetical protein
MQTAVTHTYSTVYGTFQNIYEYRRLRFQAQSRKSLVEIGQLAVLGAGGLVPGQAVLLQPPHLSQPSLQLNTLLLLGLSLPKNGQFNRV